MDNIIRSDLYATKDRLTNTLLASCDILFNRFTKPAFWSKKRIPLSRLCPFRPYIFSRFHLSNWVHFAKAVADVVSDTHGVRPINRIGRKTGRIAGLGRHKYISRL